MSNLSKESIAKMRLDVIRYGYLRKDEIKQLLRHIAHLEKQLKAVNNLDAIQTENASLKQLLSERWDVLHDAAAFVYGAGHNFLYKQISDHLDAGAYPGYDDDQKKKSE